MLRFIDRLLDTITMYRLLLYYLIALLGVAAGLSMAGYIHYNPLAIAGSALGLVAVCWAANTVFTAAYKAPSNVESVYITALILALIIPPAVTLRGALFLLMAGVLAMASKYMLAIGRQHVFNPAAVAVLLTSLGGGQAASWWVGSAALLPFVLAGGLLLVRKIRRMQMALSFLASVFIVTVLYTFVRQGDMLLTLQKIALDTAVFFLAFVMLTEPVSSPSTLKKQRWYGVLVGALFPPQLHVGMLYATPEMALIAGNIFSYLIEPKSKLFPRLVAKTKLAPNIMGFTFSSKKKLAFQPGQYMEWTLPHHADTRGHRRYFTLASSPTEKDIRLGVKFYPRGSSFKAALLAMDAQTAIAAANVAGDFVLSTDTQRKLAFIAGGVGVTPYRSMLKYLMDTKQVRDISMLYSAKQTDEIVYTDVLEAARQRLGAHVVYTLTGAHATTPNSYYRRGLITAELIKREIPDYSERLFYISGSHAMVTAVEDMLHGLGVPRSHIKRDFFPGLA